MRTRKNTQTEAQRKAKEAYTRAQRDIAGLLDNLRTEAKEHARLVYAKEDGCPSWEDYGNIAHTRELLTHALAFLGGCWWNEADIDATMEGAKNLKMEGAGEDQSSR